MRLKYVIETLYPECQWHRNRIVPCPLCGHGKDKPSCQYYPEEDKIFCHHPDCTKHPLDISEFLRISGNLLSGMKLLKDLPVQPAEIGQVSTCTVHRTGAKPPAKEINPTIYTLFSELAESQLKEASRYQTEVRGHRLATLKKLHVGFVPFFVDFYRLLAEAGKGIYSEDDVTESGLFSFDKSSKFGAVIKYRGYYTYPIYQDGLVRSIKFKPHVEREDWEKPTPKNLSTEDTGDDFLPIFGSDPRSREYGYYHVVEGENDALSMIEHGYPNTFALMGGINRRALMFLPRDVDYWMAFDNDDAGKSHRKEFETHFPTAERLDYPEHFKDPDEWLQSIRKKKPSRRQGE